MSLLTCVVVIGPDRSPIFIHKTKVAESQETDILLFDAIAQFQKAPKKQVIKSSDRLTKDLVQSQKTNVSSYRANLKYTILVFCPSNLNIIEKTLMQFFETVSNCLFSAISDPFYQPFSYINSISFKNSILKASLDVKTVPSANEKV